LAFLTVEMLAVMSGVESEDLVVLLASSSVAMLDYWWAQKLTDLMELLLVVNSVASKEAI